MKMSPVLRSPKARVYLRRPEWSDLAELTECYRSSRKHFAGYAASAYDAARHEQLVHDSASDANEYFLVCTVTDDAIVGTLNLSQIFRRKFQNAYLGYQLFAGSTGKGYMTEAVGLALRFAFNDLKLHRIEASVQPSNTASIAVLKRSGFIYEGTASRYLKINGRWRDHERWAIIKENWKPKRI
jgi:ribosomal-protein-alanine N-acetyltransferase